MQPAFPTQPPAPSPVVLQVPVMQQLEEGIKGLLAAFASVGLIIQTQVEVLPENKAGIEDAIPKDGARVTIAYRQSDFGETARNEGQIMYAGLGATAAQTEVLNADIVIQARGRSNSKGVYQVIEAVRYFLLGQVPFPGARALWFTGQQLDGFEERGTWRYVLSVATSTVLVARYSSAESALTSVSFALAEINGTVQTSPIQLPGNYGPGK